MIFSPTCLLHPWRSIGPSRLWSRVLASPYSTSAILHSPSPLKMDARNVYDREWRRNNLESRRRQEAEWRQKDPIKRRQEARTWYYREQNSLYKRMFNFLWKFDWPLQHLTWKTHIPTKTEAKTKRACSTCGRYESQGLRLWWMRRDSGTPAPNAYDCPGCFRKSNPEAVVPIEYEGLALEDALTAMREDRKQHVKSAGSS
jgi:hypothetical protein